MIDGHLDEDERRIRLGETEDTSIVCELCGARKANVGAAIDADWVPEFWDGDDEYGPACDTCSAVYLEEDPTDGELVLRKFIGV